ncbi:hypothetical protein Q3G72_025131 [Acer saccharum]|nr:hypothetical protein Q3G72_025131 [Acer saccharum]
MVVLITLTHHRPVTRISLTILLLKSSAKGSTATDAPPPPPPPSKPRLDFLNSKPPANYVAGMVVEPLVSPLGLILGWLALLPTFMDLHRVALVRFDEDDDDKMWDYGWWWLGFDWRR